MDGYPFTSLAFFYTEQLLTSRCLLVVIGAIIGIVTTSAASDILGDIYWEAYDLLSAMQKFYDNSSKS
jgi:hypothetical protein